MESLKMVQAQAKVKAWNRAVQVGTPVLLVEDLGEITEATTRSVASVVGNHASVLLDGKVGSWTLSRMFPISVDEVVRP